MLDPKNVYTAGLTQGVCSSVIENILNVTDCIEADDSIQLLKEPLMLKRNIPRSEGDSCWAEQEKLQSDTKKLIYREKEIRIEIIEKTQLRFTI